MEIEKVSPEFAQELTEINAEISEKREQLAHESETHGDEQLARSALSGAIHQAAGTVQKPAFAERLPASYLDSIDPQTTAAINALIDKIHQHGLAAAIAEAREASPYILDVFHDALVEKLYVELTANKLL